MAASPLVSVVIPTRDRNVEVRRAIASALRQTVGDLEIIVVDDGSLDPTATALAGLATDARVSIHRNDPAGGPSAARNTGNALARGSFVAYLDSDDEWHPTKLERQLGALRRSDRAAGLSLCGYEVVSGDVRRARVPREVRAGNAVQLLDPRHEPTVTSCFVLPADIARAEGFDDALAAYEDLDLAARVARTHDVVTTPSILVRKYVSTERQFSGPRVIDARRALLTKYEAVLSARPAVLARNQLTMASELARSGNTDEALAVLESIDARHLSLWIRAARRAAPRWAGSGQSGRLGKLLDILRLAERFSVDGALWHLRTSRLRWQAP